MHIKAKAMALCGLMLALTVVCMILGSVIETNTLFLLAAASYFVGIVIREFGLGMGAAFYLAAVLLGLIIAPNKFYVMTFGAMGLYILAIEYLFKRLYGIPGDRKKKTIFLLFKYAVFNALYIPAALGFQQLLFSKELTSTVTILVLAAGQVGLLLYDKAYEYVQCRIWSRIRGKIM